MLNLTDDEGKSLFDEFMLKITYPDPDTECPDGCEKNDIN